MVNKRKAETRQPTTNPGNMRLAVALEFVLFVVLFAMVSGILYFTIPQDTMGGYVLFGSISLGIEIFMMYLIYSKAEALRNKKQ